MKDEERGVRIHALRLAELYPMLSSEVITLREDEYARVVMQSALSMGNFSSPEVIPALADILLKHYSDHWMRLAVLSSEAGSELDRKSTRLNSSHVAISYAVFCLKKKK